MKEWYLERVEKLEKQVAFAKIGYEQTIKTLGEKLSKCSLEESEKVIREIKDSTDAMKALEADYDSALKSYREYGTQGGSNNG